MKLRIPLCISMLAASMLLSGCSPILGAVCFLSRCKPTPLLDQRTGELVHDKYLEAGQETLEYFQMDFLGQYTVKHAFINDYHPSSKRCYLGSPIDNVQVVMNHLKNADNVPAIVVTRKGLPPRPIAPVLADNRSEFIGRTYYKRDTPPDAPQEVLRVDFDPLCHVSFLYSKRISFGIRSATSESIQTHVQNMVARVNDRRNSDPYYNSRHFLDLPKTEQVWGNPWTWYRAYLPAETSSGGDTMETWMTPIGDTGYYITVNFKFIKSERDSNTEAYQRARQLMDSVLQSVVIQKR
ncbi:DUF769 domain-containing protein [Xylella fastidiosa]|uniref:DUF769 domain-containing protein n=1 Tax=Xylella fastidiosa TaxID=2371 RepID=A0ABC8AGQ9_XYLFS|nr:DUF769 domain-containing protein [Xylella fastidiosa]ALR07569.1 DUF769 domain-containing protein [Xylella fastidiosa]